MRVLLIEDDIADAVLVEEFLADAGDNLVVRTSRTLAAALISLASEGAECVVLDLGLPDAMGFEALTRVLAVAPHTAVIVLTGLEDRAVGVEAVARGAQDYLVKGEVDGDRLTRAVRYAVERRRAEEVGRRLFRAEARRAENLRLQRGLLPRPMINDPSVTWVTRYRPGGGETLLGGDFLDAVELADGRVRAVVGDVAGHGPDEAALGVALRIAWRTLVLAGTPDDEVLACLQDVLESERNLSETFTTLVDVTVAADRSRVLLRLAGHPDPLLLGPAPLALSGERRGPALGLGQCRRWPAVEVPLEAPWHLLLFTDGLIEGRDLPGPERLGMEGLVDLVAHRFEPGPQAARALAQPLHGEAFLDFLVSEAERRNGGPLADDVAVVLLGWPRA